MRVDGHRVLEESTRLVLRPTRTRQHLRRTLLVSQVRLVLLLLVAHRGIDLLEVRASDWASVVQSQVRCLGGQRVATCARFARQRIVRRSRRVRAHMLRRRERREARVGRQVGKCQLLLLRPEVLLLLRVVGVLQVDQ